MPFLQLMRSISASLGFSRARSQVSKPTLLSLSYSYQTQSKSTGHHVNFEKSRDLIKNRLLTIKNAHRDAMYTPLAEAFNEFGAKVDKCESLSCLKGLMNTTTSNGYSYKNILFGWFGVRPFRKNETGEEVFSTEDDLLSAICAAELPQYKKTEICTIRDFLKYQLSYAADEGQLDASLLKAVYECIDRLNHCQDSPSLYKTFDQPLRRNRELTLRRILHQYTDLKTYRINAVGEELPLKSYEIECKIEALRKLNPVRLDNRR